MQVRIRFVIYGFIAPKINTPKCIYVIHITQNLSVHGLTLKILKMPIHVKVAIYRQILNVPTKKPQRSKTLYIVGKMSPVEYKRQVPFFFPSFLTKQKKLKLLFFLTHSLPAQVDWRHLVYFSLKRRNAYLRSPPLSLQFVPVK